MRSGPVISTVVVWEAPQAIAVAREVAAAHDGRVAAAQGGTLVAAFPSVRGGVLAAVDLEQQLASGRSEATARGGLAVGDVRWTDGVCEGTPVVVATRLCDRAAPGEVIVADSLRVLVDDDLRPLLVPLPEGFVLASVGARGGARRPAALPAAVAADAVPFVLRAALRSFTELLCLLDGATQQGGSAAHEGENRALPVGPCVTGLAILPTSATPTRCQPTQAGGATDPSGSTLEALPVTAVDGLSAREVTVLRLVAAGCSNREIGVRLHISQNTAANHVRAILAKTGALNRAGAVAFAAQRGLLGRGETTV